MRSPWGRCIICDCGGGLNNENVYLCSDCASRGVVAAPSASTNSAMVPCPSYSCDSECVLDFDRKCGADACMVAQHQ